MTAAAVIDRAPAARLPSPPGDLAIWIFILAELLVFGLLFVAYAFARAGDVALFNHHQQELDQAAGLMNTLLLVTGS
jgi:nitric oxide reductase NorE protein